MLQLLLAFLAGGALSRAFWLKWRQVKLKLKVHFINLQVAFSASMSTEICI